MQAVIAVTIAVEGLSDVPVARRILEHAGLHEGRTYVRHGKGNLDRNLRGYNSAAEVAPWLTIRDLDHDAPCAATLVAALLPVRSRWMCFRIAVREAEAWLLADHEGMARYLRVARHLLPDYPDSLDDPKATLVSIARRSSSRAIREDIVPSLTAAVGPGYVSRISDFAQQGWSIERAVTRSRSLERCVARVKELRAWPRPRGARP
ncbi:MAG: hypothetical protein IT183_11685 [Acidobacteria bacterium]|nr:hypothetical protein [Acidobacteriota bacterium]